LALRVVTNQVVTTNEANDEYANRIEANRMAFGCVDYVLDRLAVNEEEEEINEALMLHHWTLEAMTATSNVLHSCADSETIKGVVVAVEEQEEEDDDDEDGIKEG